MLQPLTSRTLPLMLLFLVICNPLQAAADSTLDRIKERGVLVLGTSGNMPSMSEVDSAGKVSGFDIDLARTMASFMGVKLEVHVMPFTELLPALEAGKVDVLISNMTITPERNLRAAFVGPYMVSGKCIVTKDQALAAAEKSGDLNTPETQLAVLAGSTSKDFAQELFPKATLFEVDDYSKGAQLVSDDTVAGMLTDYPICLATLKSHPDAGFVSVFSLLTYEPIGIALPAGDAQFINWTENFLDRMDKTNGLKEFGHRWFGEFKLAR